MRQFVALGRRHKLATVNTIGCGFDSYSRKFLVLLIRKSASIRKPPEFTGKW